MDNVVDIFSARNNIKVEEEDSTHVFISTHLIPWAEGHGIDVDSKLFKLNAATIMACLQGMIVDK